MLKGSCWASVSTQIKKQSFHFNIFQKPVSTSHDVFLQFHHSLQFNVIFAVLYLQKKIWFLLVRCGKWYERLQKLSLANFLDLWTRSYWLQFSHHHWKLPSVFVSFSSFHKKNFYSCFISSKTISLSHINYFDIILFPFCSSSCLSPFQLSPYPPTPWTHLHLHTRPSPRGTTLSSIASPPRKCHSFPLHGIN